jgi:hypothetical protein
VALLTTGVFLHLKREELQRFWQRWLVVSVPMSKADALIVLGGESLDRPQMAARLYLEGVARRIYVTGEGDAGRSRQRLMEGGVAPEDVVLEKKAVTTYENATLLRPILESRGIRSAVLVTSPFHTRRALATFRHEIPGISFGVVGAGSQRWSLDRQNRMALLEFGKILEYRILHGIPF